MYYEAISQVLPGVKLYINTGGQGGDVQMMPGQGILEGLQLRLVIQKLQGLAMGVSGEAAAADFHGLDALGGETRHRLRSKDLYLQKHRKNAQFHKEPTSLE